MLINPNIFYYDNDKNFYANRVDAERSKKDCFFYYYDREFVKVDWTTEPTTSLSELYRQRAQQIRDSYEYVILCYSGGIDSTVMLETFYYNNIHIDEILTVGALSQDTEKGTDDNHNGDLYHNVFPTLNDMHLPNTKITVADYTEHFRDFNKFSLVQKYDTDYVKHIGAFTSVTHLWWHDLRRFIGTNEKKTAVVFGTDKPRMSILDPLALKVYTDFTDIAVSDYGCNYLDQNFERVNFYTHPDAQEIMRKQLHICMNFYYGFLGEDRGNIKAFNKHTLFCKNYEQIIVKLIYPDVKHPLKHFSQKSQSTGFSNRDRFMLNKTDSDLFKFYIESNRQLTTDLLEGKRHFLSRRYYIK
jgi:hypothetical protein